MNNRPLARVLLVAGLTLGVTPVLGVNPAQACSCVQADEQEQFEQATHVFKAIVNGVEGTFPRDGSSGSRTYSFNVGSIYKGEVDDPQAVSTAGDSAACGVDLEGAGPFLVFAGAGESAGELSMNLCGGTREIGADEEPDFTAPGPGEPGDQDPGGGGTPSEGEEAGVVGQAVSAVAGYFDELLGPLRE